MDAGIMLIERCRLYEERIKELVKHVCELIERNAELEAEIKILKLAKGENHEHQQNKNKLEKAGKIQGAPDEKGDAR